MVSCGLRPSRPTVLVLAWEHSRRAVLPDADVRLSVVNVWDTDAGEGEGEGAVNGTFRGEVATANARAVGRVEAAMLPLLRQHSSGNTTWLQQLNATTATGGELPVQLLTPRLGSEAGPAAAPLLLFYRRDWWERLVAAADSGSVRNSSSSSWLPPTWPLLVRLLGQLVNRDLDGDGAPDHVLCADLMPGCIGGPLLAAVFASLTQTHGTRQGFWFNTTDLSPAIGGPAMQSALQLYTALAASNTALFTPGGVAVSRSNVTVTPDELAAGGSAVDPASGAPLCGAVNPLFAAGRCLFTIDWATAALRLTRQGAPGVSGAVAAGLLPGSTAVLPALLATGRGAGLAPCTQLLCPNASSSDGPAQQWTARLLDHLSSVTAQPPAAASRPLPAPSTPPLPQPQQLLASDSSFLLPVSRAPFVGEASAVWAIEPSQPPPSYLRAEDFVRLATFELDLKYDALVAAAGGSNSSGASVPGVQPQQLSAAETEALLDMNPDDLAAVAQAVRSALRHPNAAMDILLPHSSQYRHVLDDLALQALQLAPSSDVDAADTEAAALREGRQQALVVAAAGRFRTIMEAFPYPGILLQLHWQAIGFLPATRSDEESDSDAAKQDDRASASLRIGLPVAVAVGGTALLALLAGLCAVWVSRRSAGRTTRFRTTRPPGAGPGTTLIMTDVQNSTLLWEVLPPDIMDLCVSIHHRIMREAIAANAGHEAFTEGDAFAVAFHGPDDALGFALFVQEALLLADWPPELLDQPDGCEVWARRCSPSAVSQMAMAGSVAATAMSALLPPLIEGAEGGTDSSNTPTKGNTDGGASPASVQPPTPVAGQPSRLRHPMLPSRREMLPSPLQPVSIIPAFGETAEPGGTVSADIDAPDRGSTERRTGSGAAGGPDFLSSWQPGLVADGGNDEGAVGSARTSNNLVTPRPSAPQLFGSVGDDDGAAVESGILQPLPPAGAVAGGASSRTLANDPNLILPVRPPGGEHPPASPALPPRPPTSAPGGRSANRARFKGRSGSGSQQQQHQNVQQGQLQQQGTGEAPAAPGPAGTAFATANPTAVAALGSVPTSPTQQPHRMSSSGLLPPGPRLSNGGSAPLLFPGRQSDGAPASPLGAARGGSSRAPRGPNGRRLSVDGARPSGSGLFPAPHAVPLRSRRASHNGEVGQLDGVDGPTERDEHEDDDADSGGWRNHVNWDANDISAIPLPLASSMQSAFAASFASPSLGSVLDNEVVEAEAAAGVAPPGMGGRHSAPTQIPPSGRATFDGSTGAWWNGGGEAAGDPSAAATVSIEISPPSGVPLMTRGFRASLPRFFQTNASLPARQSMRLPPAHLLGDRQTTLNPTSTVPLPLHYLSPIAPPPSRSASRSASRIPTAAATPAGMPGRRGTMQRLTAAASAIQGRSRLATSASMVMQMPLSEEGYHGCKGGGGGAASPRPAASEPPAAIAASRRASLPRFLAALTPSFRRAHVSGEHCASSDILPGNLVPVGNPLQQQQQQMLKGAYAANTSGRDESPARAATAAPAAAFGAAAAGGAGGETVVPMSRLNGPLMVVVQPLYEGPDIGMSDGGRGTPMGWGLGTGGGGVGTDGPRSNRGPTLSVFEALWRDLNTASSSGVISDMRGGDAGSEASWLGSAACTIAAVMSTLFEALQPYEVPAALRRTTLDGAAADDDRPSAQTVGGGGGGGGGRCRSTTGAVVAGAMLEPVLAFRGLRVRVGLHSGARTAEVISSLKDGVAQTSYTGDFLAICKDVSDSAMGGVVVLSGSAFRAFQQLQYRKSRAPEVMLLHIGEHLIKAPNPEPATDRPSKFGAASEPDPTREIYAAVFPCLAPRLALLPSLVRTAAEVVPGCLSAPAGLVAPVFCNVVGVEALLAWESLVQERLMRAAAQASVVNLAPCRPLLAGDPLAAPESSGVGMVRAALEAFCDVAQETASRHGGYVVASSADGGHWVLVFGSAEAAVLWGLEMLEAMLSMHWPDGFLEHELTEEVWEDGALMERGLRLRIGIDYGRAMVRLVPRSGRLDYVGRPMNRAARIAAKAKAATVLASGAAWDAARPALGPSVSASNLGSMQLKGVREHMELWALRGRGGDEDRDGDGDNGE